VSKIEQIPGCGDAMLCHDVAESVALMVRREAAFGI
jgi:hypothetical protein